MIRNDLTTQAVQINGAFIEDLISGFTTLKSKGRESLTRSISEYEGSADGTVYKSSKYPCRELVITYVIKGTNYTELLLKQEQLARILNVNNARVIFNDEGDKYYIGSCVMGDIEEKSNGFIAGSYTILCHNPFKTALTETEVNVQTVYETSGADAYSTSVSYQVGDLVVYSNRLYKCKTATSGTWDAANWEAVKGYAFTTVNDGGYTAYPRFEVKFKEDENSGVVSSKGDCGFIQLAKGDARLQFGNPEEESITPVTRYNYNFTKNITGGFAKNSATTMPLGFYNTGTIAASTSGLKPTYGTKAKAWHGVYIYKNANAATDFTFTFTNKLALSTTASTAKKQKGIFTAMLFDGSSNPIAAMHLYKTSTSSTNGTLKYYVWKDGNAQAISTQTINLAKFRKNISSTISREGNKLIFSSGYGATVVGYLDTVDAIASVGFYQGQYDKTSAPTNLIINSKFVDGDTGNTFSSGDVLNINTEDASVIFNNGNGEQLGDVGNDWNNFFLDSGSNTIYLSYSDWVVAGYEPEVKMYYKKRWI